MPDDRSFSYPLQTVFEGAYCFHVVCPSVCLRVPTGQGKVWEICFFFKVRDKSENSVKWSRKLENLQKSGNFKIMQKKIEQADLSEMITLTVFR